MYKFKKLIPKTRQLNLPTHHKPSCWSYTRHKIHEESKVLDKLTTSVVNGLEVKNAMKLKIVVNIHVRTKFFNKYEEDAEKSFFCTATLNFSKLCSNWRTKRAYTNFRELVKIKEKKLCAKQWECKALGFLSCIGQSWVSWSWRITWQK